jgi:hypothetical protein
VIGARCEKRRNAQALENATDTGFQSGSAGVDNELSIGCQLCDE